MKKQERKTFIIVLIIVIVLIVGLIIWRNNTQSDENTTNTTGETTDNGTETIVEENKEPEKYTQVSEDGSKVNISTKLNETKDVDGFEISNIQLTMVGGETLLYASVKNNTGKDADVTPIDITFLDDEGNEMITFGGVIGDVKSGESVDLNAGTTLDFANAYDIKITLK